MSTVVLDQFETDYKESYVSGTYDQVVFGNMTVARRVNGILVITPGERGVVYGALNARSAPEPGIGRLDRNGSISYRTQPYYEKAGNCRAARHFCYDERIYDTLVPDIFGCFKVNGASPFTFLDDGDSPAQSTVALKSRGGGPEPDSAMIMFDKFVPPSEAYTEDSHNVGVDCVWTKAFPFEPKYSQVVRLQQQDFTTTNSTYNFSFLTASMSAVKFKVPRQTKGLYLGFVGSRILTDDNTFTTEYSGTLTSRWRHIWVSDVNAFRPPRTANTSVSQSAGNEDLHKVLYGFGDLNTTFFTGSYFNAKDETGHQRLGTKYMPDFRIKKIPLLIGLTNYHSNTGSIFFMSPVIRGWKYGLYSGLEQYTSAYFRQGRFGQFRDMLEQRAYTKFVEVKRSKNTTAADAPIVNAGPTSTSNAAVRSLATRGNNKKTFATKTTSAVVRVSFVDDEGNITNPALTAAQNLSFEATSSLPYFDLQFRNRTTNDISRNVKIVNLSVDQFGNIKI